MYTRGVICGIGIPGECVCVKMPVGIHIGRDSSDENDSQVVSVY